MIKNQNFEMNAGDSKKIIVPVVDEAGILLDLTGAIVRWRLGRGPSIPPLLEKESPAGITIEGTRFVITLEPADTQLLKGKFYHEAELTEIDGTVSTVMIGTAYIKSNF